MLKEYSDFYSQASAILQRVEETLEGLQFDGRKQTVEVFGAQAVSMCRGNCRAISLLLDADLFGDSIAICRSLFELCFDLVWIGSATDPAEKLARVHKLEADPYFQMSKEVKLFEIDVKSPTPLTDEERLRQFNQVLERAKRDSPYLTVTTSEGKVHFDHAPPLAERMGPELRLQYYHIYRFMCLFTHPSPMLKELHLQKVGRNGTVNDLVEKPLKEVLAYSLLFVEIIAGTAAKLMVGYAPDKTDTLQICYDELFQITEKANKGYFSTPKHKKPS